MRIGLAAVGICFAVWPALAAEIEVESKIEAVTVFPRGAEITRFADIDLPKGEHVLILKDLPASLIGNSLRVEGRTSTGLEIGSVDSRRIFVGRLDETARKNLEDQIEKLTDDRNVLNARIKTAETQKILIERLTELPVRPIGPPGTTTPSTGEDWDTIYDIIGKRLAQVYSLIQETMIRRRKIDREIKKLKKKLTEQPAKQERRTEVKIHAVAGVKLKGRLKLRYQVRDAWWQPFYDARLIIGEKGKPSTLDLVRRGAIGQRTGEVWDKVALRLSTTRPGQGTAAPVLRPLNVDFFTPPPPRPMLSRKLRKRGFAQDQMAQQEAAPAEADSDKAGGRVQAKLVRATERRAKVQKYAFQAVFVIPGRVTIDTTGANKKLRISSEKLVPEVTVRAVPKLNTTAYLYAGFTLKKGVTALLPGRAALYRDGVFAGAGRIPLVNPGDEHILGFGVDDGVKVRRKEVKRSKGKAGLITSSNTDERGYKITVNNLHDRSIKVTILDQIPYALNEKIVVSLLSSSTTPTRRDVKDKRGVLAWDYDMKPGEERVIKLNYKLSWPTDKEISFRR